MRTDKDRRRDIIPAILMLMGIIAVTQWFIYHLLIDFATVLFGENAKVVLICVIAFSLVITFTAVAKALNLFGDE